MVNQANATNFKMQKGQFINYVAISLLEAMGNTTPTQAEIDAIEKVISLYVKHSS